ncbi:MAG TPA: hypothetical protein VMT62_00045, partial [Syntrophorhabdaceae bacterium]|nr:hypothetical protein [Syntrophorhabdaceae bacterium]
MEGELRSKVYTIRKDTVERPCPFYFKTAEYQSKAAMLSEFLKINLTGRKGKDSCGRRIRDWSLPFIGVIYNIMDVPAPLSLCVPLSEPFTQA